MGRSEMESQQKTGIAPACLCLELQGLGGEEGIRTLVPDFSDHPISSRRRYDHFGTSPERAR
jgi:hypothetical protein